MKALVGAFNQEKALVGAFSVIVKLVVEPMDHFTALVVRGGPRVAGLVTEVKDWRRLFVLHCGRGAGIMMCALALAVATLPCFCHEDYGCVCGCNERNSGDLLSSREDV